MARLPTVADLGPTPRANATRPIANYSGGGEAFAAGGRALGAGIAKFGEGAGELALDENRWDYAKAHSDFVAKKYELDGRLHEDQNYGLDADGKTMPQRYESDATKLRDESAALIRDPHMRERFATDTQPMLAHVGVQAQTRARGLENSASAAYVIAQGDNLIDKAVSAGDDEQRRGLIDAHNQLVDGLAAKGAITPVQAVHMKQQWAQQYKVADNLAAINSGDPQRIEAALNRLRPAPDTQRDLVDRMIQVESNGDPHARAKTSSAYGAAQFLASREGGDTTWRDLLAKHHPELVAGKSLDEINALRADPRLSREMLGKIIEQNAGILKHNGVEATPGALYLSHFLGPKSAVAVLQASPGKPVLDVLADAVGRDMARAMVAANPEVLGGKLAGSVASWADNKMGGANPHEFIPLQPEVRERLIAQAQSALQKQHINDLSGFKSRWQDTVAEAYNNTEGPKAPMTLEEFARAVGAEKAPAAFKSYQGELQLAADIHKVGDMSPAEQRALYESYTPAPGEGFAEAAKRQDTLEKAIAKVNQERKNPADFAVSKLPAARDAWSAFTEKLTDATASPEDRKAAARDFATKTLLEQQRVDIPEEQRAILPKGYVDALSKRIAGAADSDDPTKRMSLVGQIEQEARLWGEHWGDVMRQLAPTAQPVVRAIAAGADPIAMTRLLNLKKDENPGKILKEQNETKFRDVTKALNDAMAPFARSLVGRQMDRDFGDYYGLVEKLSALYVRDGKSVTDAADAAFKALIGNRYEFRDTWRLPKSSGADPDDIQKGTLAARNALRDIARPGAAAAGPLAGVAPAVNDIGIADNRSDSLTKFARDGTFVTAPDNSGLNLIYGDKTVRDVNGKPVFLSWEQLQALAKGYTRPAPVARQMPGMN